MTEAAPRPSSEDGVPRQDPSDRGRRARAVLSVTLIAGVALAALWLRWPPASPAPGVRATAGPPRTTPTTRPGPDHPPVLEKPDPDARPGVAYVGSSACAPCHSEIARRYARHPMGRSLRPLRESIAGGAAPFRDQPAFEAAGFSYAIEHRGERIDHVEIRRDAQGTEIVRNQAEAR